MKYLGICLALVVAMALSLAALDAFENAGRERRADAMDLIEVANGDAQFWLMQGAPNNRYIPCTVHYHFNEAVDEALLIERLKELVGRYQMFNRNIVEIDGLPYWQSVEPNWQENFRRLDKDEDLASVRVRADRALSVAQPVGDGIPLFRAYLSADGRQLTFMWHHVMSDFEGMFNKHAKHLFNLGVERTRFGYQMDESPVDSDRRGGSISLAHAMNDRPLGFEQTGFDVSRHVLPISDAALHDLGVSAGLPMSDIFSFITMRAVSHYHESPDDPERHGLRPVVSPLSLRKSSLETDEGNNRAIKQFPLAFPLEDVETMHQRIMRLEPSATSYEAAGRAMKFVRRYSILESPFRRMVSPDYISNYFPLADMRLQIGDAELVRHDLRVPVVPFERSKFAWSNYDGEVQLFLHTDSVLVDADRMKIAFGRASNEVLSYLSEQQ